MKLVVTPGKSNKNKCSYILLTPDAQQAIDAIIKRRGMVVNQKNPFLFARPTTEDTCFEGTYAIDQMRDLCHKTVTLKYPDRITCTKCRKYLSTVSQVCLITKTYLYKYVR